MRIVECSGDLPGHIDDIGQRQWPTIHHIFERAAFQIAHYNIWGVMPPVKIVDRYQMGMLQAGDKPRLSLEAFQRRVISGDVFLDHLYRDETVYIGLVGAINCRHATIPNFFNYFVNTNARTDHANYNPDAARDTLRSVTQAAKVRIALRILRLDFHILLFL